MKLNTSEIPKLLLLVLLAGVAYIVVAKITGKVGDQINAVFK